MGSEDLFLEKIKKVVQKHKTFFYIRIFTPETGDVSFYSDATEEQICSELDSKLNTIALDKLMDDTTEEDDFHKRKY